MHRVQNIKYMNAGSRNDAAINLTWNEGLTLMTCPLRVHQCAICSVDHVLEPVCGTCPPPQPAASQAAGTHQQGDSTHNSSSHSHFKGLPGRVTNITMCFLCSLCHIGACCESCSLLCVSCGCSASWKLR